MHRRWWPALAVATVVLVFSLVPLGGAGGGSVAVLGVGADKLLHVVDYAVLALALAYAVRTRDPTTLLAVFIVAVLFGGVVELLQGLVPTRGASLWDAAANVIGAALGTAGWWLDGAVQDRGG